MKKITLFALSISLMAGCRTASVSSTPTPTASPEGTSESMPMISTTQTSPVTLTAEGVIQDIEMSTITLNSLGNELCLRKADEFVADGVLSIGTPVETQYVVDTDGTYVALSMKATEASQIQATLISEAMSTLSATVDVQDTSMEVNFLKSESYVSEEDLVEGDRIQITYTGELDQDPTILSAGKVEEGSIQMSGVVVDASMNSILLKCDEDSSIRTFQTSDDFQVVGELMPYHEGRITYTFGADGSPIASAIVMNEAPRSLTGILTSEAMSTITIAAQDIDRSFLKSDVCVEEEGLQEGDTVQVFYHGEIDGEPQAYGICKAS